MILHSSEATLAAPIDRIVARLNGVRRGIVARTVLAGMAKTLWLAIGLAAADLAIDRTLHLDFGQRAVMLAILVSLLLWRTYRGLWAPLTANVTDDALVLAIEAANPRLKQSLITALQLSRAPHQAEQGTSLALRERAILSGCKRAEEISFGSILESRQAVRNAVLVAGAALCLVGCIAAFPFSPTLRIWFSRNVLLSRVNWPQETYLLIERLTDEGTVVFPRGGDWTQAVEVSQKSAVVPDAIYLELREGASGKRRTSLVMQRIAERRFEAIFHDVRQPFEFRARGGDAATDWVSVELVEPPALRELEITVVGPKYSALPAQVLTPGQSAYQLLRGSRLEVKATANKRLATAELVHEQKRWPLTADGDKHPEQFFIQMPAGEFQDGTYSMELVDTRGLSASAAHFTLRWLADQKPSVTARLEGIGNLVLPQARLPIRCQASDDFGLTSVVADVGFTAGGTNEQMQSIYRPLVEPGRLGTLGEPTQRREATVIQSIDLEPLKLVVGANLRLQIEATDNNDMTGPATGNSSEFFWRVVGEAELRSELLRREKAERQELERIWKAQEDMLTESRVLAAAAKTQSPASQSPIDQLQSIYRGQKQIGQKLTVLADRIAALAAEIENNRLPDPDATLQNRLRKRIAEPLTELATKDVARLVSGLERGRQSTDAAGDLDWTQTIDSQQAIARGIKQILEQMLTSEGYQEAIELLYEIQKAQGEVYEQTNKAREERIKRILEGRK